MDKNWIFSEAAKIESRIVSHRRNLHETPEVGFSLEKTYNYVFNTLSDMGYKPQKCGKMGIVAEIKGEMTTYAFTPYSPSINTDDICDSKVTKKSASVVERHILLRADMDALPMEEKAELPFKSKNGCMHSCGHDMHTAILLGVAEILIKNKDKFSSEITLSFQPAEETLEGAKDMIESGIFLNKKRIDFGIMLHALTDTNLDTGTLILPDYPIIAPSAEFFEIEIRGFGAHGAMPSKTVDPILTAAHIALALEELITRECAGINGTALTLGELSGGNAPNVIPERVKISGTLRSYDEKTTERLKKRIEEITTLQSEVFNASSTVRFTSGCPTFKNDTDLAKSAYTCLKSAFSDANFPLKGHKPPSVILAPPSPTQSSLASEDFAYFSQEIPSIMIALASGKSEDGYSYPLHNPKTVFDEKALIYGTIALSAIAAEIK